MEWYRCDLPKSLWEVHINILENVRGVYKYNKCPHYERRDK